MAQAIPAHSPSETRGSRGVLQVTATFLALLVAVAIAVSVGEPISLRRALADSTSIDHTILFRVRLPRALLGVFAGAGLATTGTAFQALLRNPLAEPYVLGVAGGAALGATLSLAIGLGTVLFERLLGPGAAAETLGNASTALAAAVGGALATALVYTLAARGMGRRRRSHRGDATSILLAGVIVNAIAASAITFIKTVVRASTAQQLLFWLAGFLDVPTPLSLATVGVAVTLGAALLVADAPRLNLLSLGDEQASHLGVDVRKLERRVFFASSIMIGAVVATCGIVSFVGLLVPHVLRRLFGPDHRVLLPASLFGGGAALVLCDAAARVTFRFLGTEPPVGAITALLGGPLFLFLLTRQSDDGRTAPEK
jgi:iron complex transport system permease protein